MAERARARCPRCGAIVEPNEPCRSQLCASTRETLRPRHSQPQDIRQVSPSGMFEVHESERTTYHELVHSQEPAPGGELSAEIPAEPRVPSFSEPPLSESSSQPPTRRDLPKPTDPPKSRQDGR